MAIAPSDVSARGRLIASARRLFNLGTYGSVGVQELCEDADVRRGSFYYHFESKQKLALAALNAEWEEQRTSIYEPAFRRNYPPLKAFEVYQQLLHEYHRRRLAETGQFGGCLIISLAQELAPIDPVIRDKAADICTGGARYFEAAFEDAVAQGDLPPVDTAAASRRVLSYVEGMLALARVRSDPDVIERLRYDLARFAAAPD